MYIIIAILRKYSSLSLGFAPSPPLQHSAHSATQPGGDWASAILHPAPVQYASLPPWRDLPLLPYQAKPGGHLLTCSGLKRHPSFHCPPPISDYKPRSNNWIYSLKRTLLLFITHSQQYSQDTTLATVRFVYLVVMYT